jgi:hypothetical protein
VAAPMSDLEQRIAKLEAAEAIRAVFADYCELIDSGRLGDEFGALLSPDAVMRNPNAVEGREAIVAYYENFLGTVSFSRHHIVNQKIEIDGESARHRAHFLAMLGREGKSLLVFGGYDDRLERGGDGWVISEKVNITRGLTTLEDGWGGDLSQSAPSRPR